MKLNIKLVKLYSNYVQNKFILLSNLNIIY
jgi:hypothetical protein